MKIHIPTIEETTNKTENYTVSSELDNNNSSNTQQNKININTATQEQLETLPGIGPSIATKIINYRKEKGKFKNIEDIKQVSGIGESKFEKIKNYITVK